MSITLTNAYSVKSGATTLESDPQSAAMEVDILYTLNTPVVTITFKAGNVSGLSLVPGTVGQITLNVNLTTGEWSSSDGRSGVIAASPLASLVATLKGFRNTAETFAVNNGIVSGIQVPW